MWPILPPEPLLEHHAQQQWQWKAQRRELKSCAAVESLEEVGVESSEEEAGTSSTAATALESSEGSQDSEDPSAFSDGVCAAEEPSVYNDVAAWPFPVPDDLGLSMIRLGSELLQNKDGPFHSAMLVGAGRVYKRCMNRSWFYKASVGGAEKFYENGVLSINPFTVLLLLQTIS